jgi:hypothetical protein
MITQIKHTNNSNLDLKVHQWEVIKGVLWEKQWPL